MASENKDKEIEVSVTIPIYNEEAGIEETIVHLTEEFEKKKTDYELVLVNHGSWDNTHLVLEKLAKKNKRLKVHNLPKNLGYGGGIMYGFEHSKGKYIGFTCADEEVSADDVFRVFDALRKSDYENFAKLKKTAKFSGEPFENSLNNNEMANYSKFSYDVSKSRRMNRKDGLFRKFTSFVFNSSIELRFGLGLRDVNGYPIFIKRELFPSVKTKETAYLFNLDFLRNMKNKGYRITEIPIIHHERKKGKSFMKLSRIFKMAFGFLKYAWRVKH